MLSLPELSELKNKLPRGYFSRVVAKTTFKERTVSNFFMGKTYRVEIHQAALEVLQEEKEKIENTAIQHKTLVG